MPALCPSQALLTLLFVPLLVMVGAQLLCRLGRPSSWKQGRKDNNRTFAPGCLQGVTFILIHGGPWLPVYMGGG